MMPLFPTVKRVTISDQETITRIVKKYPPYSDFNFVSLFTYNTTDEVMFSILHDNLIIQFSDYITHTPFLSFLGENNIDETITMLLVYAKQQGITEKLGLIPEFIVTHPLLTQKNYVIAEDTDNTDYVLSVAELATLKSKKYDNKRHLINRFLHETPQYTIIPLDLTDIVTQSQMSHLFHIWAEQTNKTEEEYIYEQTLIHRLIASAHAFSLISLGLYTNNRLIGYAIAEQVNTTDAIFHFVKGNYLYKGVFEMLYMSLAKILQEKGCIYLNIEQDLGISGLKHTKQQWNPVFLLKKYTITKKNP